MSIENLVNIPRNYAAKIVAIRDHQDGDEKRVAGDEWLIHGPQIYHPRVEAKLDSIRNPYTIGKDQALKVKALRDTKDYEGNERKDGEQWLVKAQGFYINSINEEVIEKLNPIVITERECI